MKNKRVVRNGIVFLMVLIMACGWMTSFHFVVNAGTPDAGTSDLATGSAYDYKEVLGDAVYYGIVADTLNLSGHMDSNCAVKNLVKKGQDNFTVGRYTNHLGSSIMAHISSTNKDDTQGFRIDKPTDKFSDEDPVVYTNEEDASFINTSGWNVNIKYNDADTLEDVVESIMSHVEAEGKAMLNEESVSFDMTGVDPNNICLDFTEGAEDGTFYVDGDSFFGQDQYGGNRPAITINKKDTQKVIFNFSGTNVCIRDYNIVLGDVKYTTGAYDAIHALVPSGRDAMVSETVVFNAPNATSFTIQGTTMGTIIAPNADVIKHGTSTGWIICNSMDTSEGQWHYVWDEVPANVPAPTVKPKATPTAAPTATAKATAAPTATAKATAAPTATAKATAAPTATAKATAAPTATAKVTAAPTATAKVTAAPTATAKVTAAPTATAKITAAPTATAKVTAAPTATAKVTAAPTATAKATAAPTATAKATAAPTATAKVTAAPTATAQVTAAPTATAKVTAAPTATAKATAAPTATAKATAAPTATPTATSEVTATPTSAPGPTQTPEITSTPAPTETQTPAPTVTPTETKAPEVSNTPEATKAPEVSNTPEATKAPEVSETPEATKAPEISNTPEATKAPEVSKTPEATKVPEVSNTPEATKAPEVSETPEATKAPEVSNTPEATKAPTVSGTPAVDSDKSTGKNSTGGLQVVIKDKVSGKPIPNAKVKIVDKDGKKVVETTSNKKGMVTVDQLKEGKYSIKVIDVPDGYNSPNSVDVKVENDKITKQQLVVSKKNSNNVSSEETTTKDSDNATASESTVPKTGDHMPIVGMTILLFVAAAVFALSFKRKRY